MERKWWTLLLVSIATFMLLLDVTVVNGVGRDPVDVVLDGALVGELASGEELEVRFREGVGRLAQLPGSNFYRRIREKFGHLAH